MTGVDDPVCDGQAYLEWMQTENLFVVSLDEGREWYRYHHLFQELISSAVYQAAYQSKEISMPCTAWPAEWFAGQGLYRGSDSTRLGRR